MSNQLIMSMLVVALAILSGIFLFQELTPADVSRNNNDISIFVPEEIVTSFTYEDGLYEYTGSVDFPNGCYELDAHAIVMESYPEQVVLVFDATGPTPEMFCTQAIKTIPFRILFSASEHATVTAKYNKNDIDLLIIQNKTLDIVEVLESFTDEGEF